MEKCVEKKKKRGKNVKGINFELKLVMCIVFVYGFI